MQRSRHARTVFDAAFQRSRRLLADPIADAAHPLEVLRTVHSFDPCMACAVHMFDPAGNNTAKVKVL